MGISTHKITVEYKFENKWAFGYSGKTVSSLGKWLKDNPGIGGKLGYGMNFRQDLECKIILEWTTDIGSQFSKEFTHVKDLTDFLKQNPDLMAAVDYVPKT